MGMPEFVAWLQHGEDMGNEKGRSEEQPFPIGVTLNQTKN